MSCFTRSSVRVAALLGLLIASDPAAVAQISAGLQARIDKVAEAEMLRQKIPGVAVGVFQHGAPLMLKGYGYANVEHKVPVTPETLFQSASIGKQFTAVVTMLQVEDGKVSLDESIRTYFPDAPASWQPVTIRHLLTHTSGIADYFEAMGTNGTEPFDVRRDYPPDELRKLFYDLPFDFAPGSDWHYSNTGYALLGFLVRRVSGRFYGDELEDRIFTPLGMHTAQVINEAQITPNRAAGYQLENEELRNQEWYAPLVNTTADGALYLSLHDYLAWERGLRSRAILRAESWNEIYTRATLNSNELYPYGFGWRIGQSKGGDWYYHSGSSQGFNLYYSRYLADELSIVVLTNLYEGEPEHIVDGITEIIDPDIAKLVPVGTDDN